jgi:hypothetical protein
MHQEHIEPFLLADFSTFRHEHLDPITPQLVMHPCVLDVPHTIHREVRITLPKEDGPDSDTLVRCVVDGFVGCEVELAKVIENARDGEDIKSAEGALLRRISGMLQLTAAWTYRTGTLGVVVVTVNREHRYCDVEVWVLVVDGGEAGTQHAERVTSLVIRPDPPESRRTSIHRIAHQLKLQDQRGACSTDPASK